MAGDAANPRIWGSIDVYAAPLGTTAPTDTTTALNAAFKAVGVITTDGVSWAHEGNATDHFAHGSILIRRTMSQEVYRFTFTALENKPTVQSVAFPNSTSVTATGTNTFTVKKWVSSPKAYVIELTDGAYKERHYIARGEGASEGDIVYNEETMTGFNVTVAVYPDATTGDFFKKISTDPAAISAP